MKVVNIHAAKTNNIGDMAAGIAQYLPGVEVKTLDIGNSFPDGGNWLDDHVVIVGGGGLFTKVWQWKLIELCNRSPLRKLAGGRLIFWGIGVNSTRVTDDHFPYALHEADLVGVRDWDRGFDWVPCASCLHPVFDKPPAPAVRAVCVWHPMYPIPIGIDAPWSDHYRPQTMQEAAAFLAQGEFVLTTSYHAAYWGTLLGRRVIVWPHASRFCFMRHMPVLAWHDQTLDALMEQAHAYPNALDECRDANIAFRQKVMGLLG